MVAKAAVRWSVMSALALAALGVLAYLFRTVPVDVTTGTIQRGPIVEAVSDEGTARVRQSYTISAPVAGRVERLTLEVGDRVVAGETLAARLRPGDVAFLDARARAQAEAAVSASSAMLDAARADKDRAFSEATHARADLDRMTVLARSGAASVQQLDDAQAALRTTSAALEAAGATVAAREAELRSAQAAVVESRGRPSGPFDVRSPASGVVTHVMQQSERPVAAGAPLIEIGDTTGLEAQIEFLTQDAVRLKPGQEAEIYDWGGSGTLPAEVRLVEPQAFTKVSALGVEEQRVLVMLEFTCPSVRWSGLAPGYRVWGRVFLRREASAITAPAGALVRHAGGWAVFAVRDGIARLTSIRVGAISDSAAEILDGVQVGDQVIVYPSDQVLDGVRVRPVR